MNLTELQAFLNSDLRENQIPIIQKKPKTFLGIAKQPHYENVISNIYAFLFNVHEEHALKDLFIKSLIQCIDESKLKTKNFSGFTDFGIETEYSTKGIGKYKKKGRIDLLLFNNEQAIIIENKVYHHLDNDIDDYWNSVKLDTENLNSKIGIILSLKPISEDNWRHFSNKDEFINITHLQLMKKVLANSHAHLQEVEERYKHFLYDFNQNILNISTAIMNTEDIHFYLKNKEKVNQLASFKYQFKLHVINEVEKAGQSINKVKLVAPRKNSFNEPRLRYYQSTKQAELLYTIVFENLFNEKGILHIIVEPRGKALKSGDVFRNIEFDENEKMILQESFYENTNAAWSHFASKAYILNTDEVANLSDFIQVHIIKDHFSSVFLKLESYLNVNPIR